MIKVFVINGTGGSGKDTFVEFVIKNATVGTIKNISTVDQVKEVARKYFKWEGQKDEKSRKMLSDLKDLMTDYCNGPFNYIIEQTQQIKDDKELYAFFVHCREPKEIQKLKDHFKGLCTTILIKRKDHFTKGNHADENVENYNYQEVINNNETLEEFEKKVISFCKWHGLKE